MGGAVEYDQLSKKPLDTVNSQTIHIGGVQILELMFENKVLLQYISKAK